MSKAPLTFKKCHRCGERIGWDETPNPICSDCAVERVAELEAENAKLRKCVGAADSEIEAWREWGARIGGDERVCGWVHQEDYGLYCLLADPPVSDIPYDRARAEVDKP